MRQLVLECPKEDQWSDYKAGAVLEGKTTAKGDPKDPRDPLRRYVAGFANTDGGFIVIGYHHQAPAEFDGARAPGGGDLSAWASRTLTPIRPALPEPRFAVATVGGKQVLIVAVGRGRTLVSCLEQGAPVHYVRMDDQTLRMPQTLAARGESRFGGRHRGRVEGGRADAGIVLGAEEAVAVGLEQRDEVV